MVNKTPKPKKSLSGGGFILGALLGTIVGGVTGILAAPKSGKATRADISRAGKKFAKQSAKELKKIQTTAEKELTKLTNKSPKK